MLDITKEGVKILVDVSITAQKIAEGRYCFMSILRDMTERKKIEETLKKTLTEILTYEKIDFLPEIIIFVPLNNMFYKNFIKPAMRFRRIKNCFKFWVKAFVF